MNLMDRKSLKNLFKKGSFPQQAHFEALIESSVNIVDDGLDKDAEDGLKLYPLGSSRKLVSFYESIQKKIPAWHIALNPDHQSKGLSFSEGQLGPSRLFLQEGGNIGIGTTTPQHVLEVNGMAGMKGRLGTYGAGLARVPANGRWQDIAINLEGNHAFEVTAYVEREVEGKKYRRALLHATAVCSYGKASWGSIKRTQSYQGFFNRIRIRWSRTPNDRTFRLQLRTATPYGSVDDQPIQIVYRLAQLWDQADESYLFLQETVASTKK